MKPCYLILLALSSPVLADAKIEPIAVDVPGGSLKGTIVVPEGEGPFPIAIIHAGSGPTDRDCNQPVLLKTDAFKMLAQELAARKIASFRFDKRATGESVKPKTEQELTIDTYADDLLECVKVVRKDKRFSKLIVIGHSEGAIIGLIAAVKGKYDGFVSLCGPGMKLSDTLRAQLKPKLGADLYKHCEETISELEAGRLVKDPPKDLMALFRPSVQPFLISVFQRDPAAIIAKIDCPTLIVQGTTDIQITTDHAKLLSDANKKAKLATIDKMNHTLKRAADLKEQQAAYTDPKLPLAPGLVDALSEFVLGISGKAR